LGFNTMHHARLTVPQPGQIERHAVLDTGVAVGSNHRHDQFFSSALTYTGCGHIERIFNRIKQCRRIATRYDKLAFNYSCGWRPLWLRVDVVTR
jgi:transposase